MEERRYTVLTCIQPGWGAEDWKEREHFDRLEDAVNFAQNEVHGPEAADVYDNFNKKFVYCGWRVDG